MAKKRGEMVIQNLGVAVLPDKRLQMAWTTMERVRAIQVSIANDIQFTQKIYNFLLPENAQDCCIDPGNGEWFVRVGGYVGDDTSGSIKWSGALGPITVVSEKAPRVPEQTSFRITKTKALENGFRLYCGTPYRKCMILEVSQTSDFQASETKYSYMKDAGIGFVCVYNLNPKHTYSIRYTMIKEFPEQTSFLIQNGVVVPNIRSLEPSVRKLGSEQTELKSNKLLVNEVLVNPNRRFSSYSEYIKYIATRESH